MEKWMITGFSGFVSRHFLDFLEKNKILSHVMGLDINEPDFTFKEFEYVKWEFEKVDLLSKEETGSLIQKFQPQYILHLASYSSVGYSWQNPVASFANNTNIFLHILDQVRMQNLKCRILSVGSSEEYGNVSEEQIPINEETPLQPISPYAVARVAQEMLSKVYSEGYGMDIVLTRSFNHIGPFQKDMFVVSSFARKLVEMKKAGIIKGIIETGDLSIVRDFVDVRDVVKAYYLLFKKGRKGKIYNICGGVGVTLDNILEKLAQLAGIQLEKKVDARLIRPNDNKVIIGSFEKIKNDTGWKPEIFLERSLEDILEYYDKRK